MLTMEESTEFAPAPAAATLTMEQQVAEILRQMQVITQENRVLRESQQTIQGQLQTVAQENLTLREEQQRLGATTSTGQGASGSGGGAGGGGVGTDSALVSKWAPDGFSGKQEDWRSWSTKFRSFVGAMKQGQVCK